MRQLEPKKINKYIQQIAKGNERAIDTLYTYTFYNMKSVAKYYLVNKDNIDDILILLYSTIIKNAEKFDSTKNGYNWMYTIVKNLAIKDNVKEQKNEYVYDYDFAVEDNSYDALNSIIINEAIEVLNDSEKKLLYRLVWEGYSVKEIAEMDNIPKSSVYTLRARAYKKMKQFLKNNE